MKLPLGKINERLVPSVLFISSMIFVAKMILAPRAIPRYVPVIFFSSLLILFSMLLLTVAMIKGRGRMVMYPVPLMILSCAVIMYLFLEGRYFFPAYYGPNPILSYSFLCSILLMLLFIGFVTFTFPIYFSAILFFFSTGYVYLLDRLKFKNVDLLLFPILVLIIIFIFLIFHLLRILYFNLHSERELSKELTEAKEKLVNQEKLASLATFAAGTAHEINNPITHMFGNIDFLEDYFTRLRDAVSLEGLNEDDERRVEEAVRDTPVIIGEYRDGFQRIIGIVDNMKQIFRQKSRYTELVDITNIIKTSADYYKKGADPGIEFDIDIDHPLFFFCSAGDMLSVFQNLISNAVEALGGDGRIIITGMKKGDELIFSIEDNGKGIRSEDLHKVFNPFFSTKKINSNMGIGLTLCKTIIAQYGGTIRIESDENEFTKVYVTIPVKEGEE